MTIDYDGRRFRNTAYGDDAPVARYRQEGSLLWADFAGGDVKKGALTGHAADDGTLEFTYTMVLADGEVIAGRCWSTPEVLPDGRIRLSERWERYGERADSGISELEEVPA
ncbi:hypothetical protein [Streptomyces purpureus]|uniref:Uncharacterized protein n=1 Tax=Streptomyces purpureus TaxID=1951 RepID=A0A918LKV3_9ACTN|nr:hypothetical protein [Streptomyces purpureus]GGT12478.1 hypothetical protein GCM10014713_01120 [Streptomyces purpureus]